MSTILNRISKRKWIDGNTTTTTKKKKKKKKNISCWILPSIKKQPWL